LVIIDALQYARSDSFEKVNKIRTISYRQGYNTDGSYGAGAQLAGHLYAQETQMIAQKIQEAEECNCGPKFVRRWKIYKRKLQVGINNYAGKVYETIW
jgi:hypothetical protein